MEWEEIDIEELKGKRKDLEKTEVQSRQYFEATAYDTEGKQIVTPSCPHCNTPYQILMGIQAGMLVPICSCLMKPWDEYFSGIPEITEWDGSEPKRDLVKVDQLYGKTIVVTEDVVFNE